MFNKLKRFFKNTSGNFAVILGVAATPVVMSMGVAIDYSRMASLQNRMEISSDAALLAAVKKLQDTRTNHTTPAAAKKILEDEFIPFFEANLISGTVAGYDSYQINFDHVNNAAHGTIKVTYKPVVMNIFHHGDIELSTEVSVNLKIIPENFVFDIVMCVDATASMQDTIDAAVANAKTFDSELRTRLGIPQNSDDAKIRIRPIFYRDYQMQSTWETLYQQAKNDAAEESGNQGSGSSSDSQAEVEAKRAAIVAKYNNSANFRRKNNGGWTRNRGTRNYRKVEFDGSTNAWDADDVNDVFYHFRSAAAAHKKHRYFFNKNDAGRAKLEAALNIWFPDAEDNGGGEPVISASESLDRKIHISGEDDGPNDPWDRVSDTEVDYAESMKAYVDFIDMNPSDGDIKAGETLAEVKEARSTDFKDFMDSEEATAPGNYDYPEAAGACLDNAMRSGWWIEDSQASRDFFKVPPGTAINNKNAQRSVRVTAIPLIVFWTDAGFQSLSLTQQMQPTQPTTFSAFHSQWSNPNIIPQDNKILMLFGPQNLVGWPTVSEWDGYVHGGSLNTGNTDAINVIADEILKKVPEVLRVSG